MEMNKSTKVTLAFLILLSTLNVFAQKFGVELGYINPRRIGTAESTTNFSGIRIGGTAAFDLKYNFSLLTGALYQVVYADKIQNYTAGDSVRYKTWGHSIDIPLRIQYTYQIANYLKVFGFAGPNFNIGLWQPQTIQATFNKNSNLGVLTGIESGNYDLYKRALIHRMNFQLGAGGGIQFRNYQLKAGYDFGINSINAVDTGSLRQGGWYISFSYQF
jgi:hypothetical protein